MTFVDSYARELQLPPSVLQRATTVALELICRYADDRDRATMYAAMPDLQTLHDKQAVAKQGKTGPLSRLRQRVRRATHNGRSTRHALRATGLDNDDVAFVSALSVYFTQHLGETLSARLLHAVPGLEAMSSWPLTPFRGEPEPPSMS